MSDACCNAGPAVAHGTHDKGEVVHLGDMRVYVVGHGKRALVVCQDIFGFDVPQTRQNCDDLAAAGFLVAMPDHFRGKPFSMTGDFSKLKSWLAENGPFEKICADVDATVELLRKRGAESFGHLGYCWGGLQSLMLSGRSDLFRAVATVHPAFLSPEVAGAVHAPVLLMPAKDDPDMTPLMSLLAAKPFGAKCEHHRYDTMTHGFAAARGDRKNPEVVAQVNDFLQRTVRFFGANL